MKTLEEPFTAAQRRELAGIVSPAITAIRAVAFLAVVALIALACRGVQELLMVGAPWWLIPTAILSLGFYRWAGRWTGGPTLRRQIRQDLAAGKLRITVLEPVVVEEIPEIEDEGPSYVIETGDGEHYLLTGQWLDGCRRRGFPWRCFGVMEAPRSGRFFGLRAMGDSMPVTGTRGPLSYQQARDLGCFQADFIHLDEAKRQLLEGFRA